MKKTYLPLFILFSFCLNLKAQLKTKIDSITDEKNSLLAYENISEFLSIIKTECKTCDEMIMERFANGTIKSKINYYKGLLHGKYESFHSNGNYKIKGFVYRGLKNGPWEYYYENGNLKIFALFDKTLKNHPTKWIEYFPNGSIKYFIELDNNFQLKTEFKLRQEGDTIFTISHLQNGTYSYIKRKTNKSNGTLSYLKTKGSLLVIYFFNERMKFIRKKFKIKSSSKRKKEETEFLLGW